MPHNPFLFIKSHCLVTVLLLLPILLFTTEASQAGEVVIDDFTTGPAPHWQNKSFKGLTRYFPCQGETRPCLQAESNGSASGLFYEIRYDPKDMPFLHWSWKVNNTIEKGDERHKQGDDYAARVYVVFPSLLFWKTKAINYIWANKLAKGASVPNAFTSNAIMIAVESGQEHIGQWISETRNILEDFRLVFGEDPPLVGAIAIMTDTDNTGEKARAYYGAIKVSSEPK